MDFLHLLLQEVTGLYAPAHSVNQATGPQHRRLTAANEDGGL